MQSIVEVRPVALATGVPSWRAQRGKTSVARGCVASAVTHEAKPSGAAAQGTLFPEAASKIGDDSHLAKRSGAVRYREVSARMYREL